MADLHDWRVAGGGGGWEVVECSRCGLWGFGGCWWQRLLTRVWPTRYGCAHRVAPTNDAGGTNDG